MLCAAALLAVAGCGGVRTVPAAERLPPLSAAAVRLAERGGREVAESTGRFRGPHGCDIPYRVFEPTGPAATDATVLLAHGFLRDLESMSGWARHWGSHGVPTVVMSLCNGGLLDGAQAAEAEDLVALADELDLGPRLYAGFSSGGLVAWLAAAQDQRAGGWLGLDPVDADGLAASAPLRPELRALALLAPPASCNAGNNMLPVLAAAAVHTLGLQAAAHCHFEYPPQPDCDALCGRVDPPAQAELSRATVRALATAEVLRQAGQGRAGEGLLQPHEGVRRLVPVALRQGSRPARTRTTITDVRTDAGG